jgi:hypothetical protein
MRGNPCLVDQYERGRDLATFVIRDWMKDGIRVVGHAAMVGWGKRVWGDRKSSIYPIFSFTLRR